MQLATKELLDSLRQAADEVFSVMMGAAGGQSGEPHESTPCDVQGDGPYDLEAAVSFSGTPSGVVLLRCCSQSAEGITRSLLMMEPDEEVELEDIKDALGECANMVTGSLKTKLLDPRGEYQLSTPTIDTCVDVEHEHQAGKLAYELTSGPVSIEIWLSEECSD